MTECSGRTLLSPLPSTMSVPPHPGYNSSLQIATKGCLGFKSKSSTQSKSDWLTVSLTTAKVITAGAECIPFPYVKGVFGTVVIILETVEKVKRNRDDLKELCGNIMDIIKIIQDQLLTHGDTGALKFKGLCEDLAGVLEGVVKLIQQLPTEASSLSGRFKEVVKLRSTADEIAGYRMRIQELRSNFMFVQLMAAIDTNMQVHKAFSTGRLPDLSATPVTQIITKCPPPSRIFHGRQHVLDKMHQFFKLDLNKQHIFLLHGLGGAGKTQIALKFIDEFASHFTDIFFIDTSTIGTIDTGLKNIATTQNAGSTAQDGLNWLCSKPAEWLLFFDNADDPNINLNSFIPHCKHGNILITSRNPGLRVYAGSDSPISDMEETEAVELLLNSAAQAITPGNKEIAAEIVQTLYYFPLAIIQAGAFISKSGALSSYLNLYAENQARLLMEQPAQSHDNYARTVYTTWQISFEQLSKPAATLLQLCSFLHHKGISEEIFSRASLYDCRSNGPSKEELNDPLEFLSQFSGPTGVWDSLRFMNVMNEITSYSLANLDPDRKLPGTISLLDGCHRWNVILRNSGPGHAAERLKDAEQLAWTVCEQRRSVLGENHPDTLDAMRSLASTYHQQQKYKVAEGLAVVVLEKQRKIFGEDDPHTLRTMGNLASTYHKLGKLQEAEELRLVVLEKRMKIFGEDHLDTLRAMGNLASTYAKLGKFKEAEELGVLVLEKQRKILGGDHLDTLVTMGSLAWTYHTLGKFKAAEELEVVVLEKRRKILGEDHLDTLRAMGNLASTYAKLGKFKEAEELGVVVLEEQRKILGEDHLDTLVTMGSLAWTHHILGKFKEAEELEVVVLEKRRKTLEEDHPDTLHTMGNLAATCYHLNKFKEAEQLYIELLDRQTALLGADHVDTLRTANFLASTCQAMENNSQDHS
ncbi:hypothetical protein DFH09DRAFT_1284374 [Mycena vulgaris]|nr:hypothetical protein DFH09DRAFT_1284374 [Mycena vulgaris]